MLQRLILIGFVFASAPALANTDASGNAGSCGEVKVDCSTHKITFPGIEDLAGSNCADPTVIDCGDSTVNGNGTIGGPHHGDIVPDGVEINNIQGMGASGGGKVFHTPNPSSGGEMKCPKGADNSRGCIHICKAVLEKLKTCNGSPLTIAGAQGKSNGDYNDSTPGGGASKCGNRVSLLEQGSFVDGFAMRERLARWISLGGLLQCVAQAQEQRDLINTFTMKAHAMIDIKSYDPETRTFEVVNLKYWGQGPLITTPEELAKSISAIKLNRLLRNPKSFVRNQYQTDREMVLMMPELVEARRAAYASK